MATHWRRDGAASTAPLTLQISHHQAVGSALFEMTMLCWCRWSLAEKNRLEGAAARASGVDVEAPRLDCSADKWHDSERPRERRNQSNWVSGPRANASDAGLCSMARRRFPASSNFASTCCLLRVVAPQACSGRGLKPLKCEKVYETSPLCSLSRSSPLKGNRRVNS